MNGLFGKLKDKVFGKRAASYPHERRRTSMFDETKTTAGIGWKRQPKPCKKGAFGGTGNNQRLRGKPGVKLIKKTVKAGISAPKRVLFAPAGGVK